jgi:hypothetical protein
MAMKDVKAIVLMAAAVLMLLGFALIMVLGRAGSAEAARGPVRIVCTTLELCPVPERGEPRRPPRRTLCPTKTEIIGFLLRGAPAGALKYRALDGTTHMIFGRDCEVIL